MKVTLKILTPKLVTQAYADWLNDPQVNKYLSCKGTQTIETCKNYILDWKGTLFGIYYEGLHIGNISVKDDTLFNKQTKTAIIGICIGRKKFWGEGLGRKALQLGINYCFVTKYKRIHACINTKNFSSINLFLRCGFKIEGLLKNADMVEGKLSDCYIVGLCFD